jgi:3-hydroxyisobutyrate dehydrogenase-like beta-hydroxyacid dehydrogenase
MNKRTVGILHPGQMGVSIAAAVKNNGHNVVWCSHGRSDDTRARATENGLGEVVTLEEFCSACDAVICICPPDAAETVAQNVVECGFRGLYVDANAISPQRAVRIAGTIQRTGAIFVDGSIIGPPAWEPNTTWLYLSGEDAATAADLFDDGPVMAVVMGEEPGQASALKMCYSANTKGTTALLTAVLGAAEALGVRGVLEDQWHKEGSGLDERVPRGARNVTAKAWRFAGEMDEISETFSDVGLPGGFHAAAADIYRRLAGFKDAEEIPPLDDVLSALLVRAPEVDA